MKKINKVENGSKKNELVVTNSEGQFTIDMTEVNKLTNKSAKIRSIFAQTNNRSAVAIALNIRYQHVRNVLEKELKRK